MIGGDTMAELSEWLKLCGASPAGARVTKYILCEKDNVPTCYRGCMRSILTPCIKACKRTVAANAMKQLALPYFLVRVLKFRENLLAASRDKLGEKQVSFVELADTCLRTCTPLWAKEWLRVCSATLNRICVKLCIKVCQRKCTQSCKLPCTRFPVNSRSHSGQHALRRVVKCMRRCLLLCLAACKRACFVLAKKWFCIKSKHIYRSMLADTAQKFTDQWIEQDLIEERKQLTNKCNVLNGCKF